MNRQPKRSTIIKRLDALELKAAAERTRREADNPDSLPTTFSGALGYVFGLAEAGLLDYSGEVPTVKPGYLPFDVTYVVVANNERRGYVFPEGEMSEEGAAAWSLVLARGLWERLRPPVHSYGDKFGGLGYPLAGYNCMGWGWRILDDACHPERATALSALIEYYTPHAGYINQPWLEPFHATQGQARADDTRLIALAMNALFHHYEWGKWLPCRHYEPYRELERGERLDFVQFLSSGE